MLEDKLLFTIS
ncbi:acetyltransferase family protein, partial [Vibrio cholerae HC-40A1]